MAWTHESFVRNMRELNTGYHGGSGRTGYFELKGLSTIDIDNEDDMAIAEVAIEYQRNRSQGVLTYWEPKKEHIEVDVPRILNKDGVMHSDFDHENITVSDIKKFIESQDNTKS